MDIVPKMIQPDLNTIAEILADDPCVCNPSIRVTFTCNGKTRVIKYKPEIVMKKNPGVEAVVVKDYIRG